MRPITWAVGIALRAFSRAQSTPTTGACRTAHRHTQTHTHAHTRTHTRTHTHTQCGAQEPRDDKIGRRIGYALTMCVCVCVCVVGLLGPWCHLLCYRLRGNITGASHVWRPCGLRTSIDEPQVHMLREFNQRRDERQTSDMIRYTLHCAVISKLAGSPKLVTACHIHDLAPHRRQAHNRPAQQPCPTCCQSG